MAEETLFFDTYAIFEIIRAGQNYENFRFRNGVTTIFNLAELNFALKREGNRQADSITKNYEQCVVDVYLEDVLKAMDLREANRELSTPDAIGYTVAKRLGIKFLTGDKEFRGMENVEFVK